jgi:SAM-dependent methyltransferase
MDQAQLDVRKLARSQWRELAESYIRFRETGSRYNDLLEVPAMRGLLGDVAGLDVLDAGCGTGVHARHCARHGARVVAVDVSHRLLVEARKLTAEEGLDVAYVEGDVEELGMFLPQRFDAVLCTVVLPFRLRRVFAEFHRVLRPGGRLYLSDLHPMFDCGRQQVRDGRPCLVVSGYFDRTIRSVDDPFGEPSGEEHATLRWRHHTLHDYFEALATSGFVVERCLEPQPSPDDRSQKAQRARSYPVFFLIQARKTRGDDAT